MTDEELAEHVADVKARLRELAWPEGNYADALDVIGRLEVEAAKWRTAAEKWHAKWDLLECDFCGTPMSIGSEGDQT